MNKLFRYLTLGLSLSLAVGSQASAIGAAAGSTIRNTATLELNDGVNTTNITSAAVEIKVQQVYNVSITPDGTTATPGQTTTAAPGQIATLTYTVTNTGNGVDTINLSAVAANASANGTINGIYLDNPTSGTVGSYDAGDTLVTNLASVPADQASTVFVRYTVTSGTTGNAAAGTSHLLNLTGTSAGDNTRTDNNNVGQVIVQTVNQLSLSNNVSLNGTPGNDVIFNNTLTNTGNGTVAASAISWDVTNVLTDKSGGAATGTYTYTYTVTGPAGTFTGTDLKTVADQAIGAGGLPSGGTLNIRVTESVPTTAQDGERNALSIKATGASNAVTVVDTVTVLRGIGAVSKKVLFCGASFSACGNDSAAGTSAINAKPGEYVAYFLEANNTGTGTLYNIRLRDALPRDFVISHVGAKTNQSGTIRFSTDGSTWVNDPATLSAMTGGSSTLYVSVENGGSSSTIDNQDVLGASKSLRMMIAGYIRNTAATTNGTVATTVTRDDSKITTP